MGESEKKMENERKEIKKIEPEDVIGEELVRWMTEGTDPNHVPRSDCG